MASNNFGGCDHDVVVLKATGHREALKLAMEHARRTFPEQDGWRGHACEVISIQDEGLLK